MSLLLRLLASAMALCAVPAHAQYLDPAFGTGGMTSYGFQPIGGADNNRDVAVVACAGPHGSLLVAGRASSDRRIVVAWLTENGALDERFSVDGKESFDLPAMSTTTFIGLCGSDGKPVIAYDVAAPGGEHDLRVLRIDPQTGKPDPTFGTGGTAAIDLDAFAANLGRIERPVALNVGANGDILLSGFYRYGASDEHSGGFVLRLTSAGAVAGRYLSNVGRPLLQEFSVAVPHADGTIWAVGRHNIAPAPAVALVRLNATSLALIDMPRSKLDEPMTVYSGRLLGSGTIAFAAATATLREPRLCTMDAQVVTCYVLPVPHLGGLPQAVVLGQVVPLPDDDLLYTGSLAPRPGVIQPERGAFYAQRVRQSGQFAKGSDAPPLVLRRAPYPDCPAGDHVFLRTTLWAGRPTLAGAYDAGCTTADADYLVMRLTLSEPLPDPVFQSGFEPRNQ